MACRRTGLGAVLAAAVLVAPIACREREGSGADASPPPAPSATSAPSPTGDGATPLEQEAQRALGEGRIEDAQRSYRQVVERFGPTAASLEGLARIYDMTKGHEAGRAYFAGLAERFPERADVHLYHSYFAQALFRSGEASESLARAIAAAPSDPKTLQRYGALCLGSGEFDRCLGVLGEPASRLADAPLLNITGVLELRAGRARDAIATFRRALELTPSDRLILANLGGALAALGDEASATEASGILETVLAADPGHSVALYTLAQLRYRQGRDDEATALMQRFRERQVFEEEQSFLAGGVAPPATAEAALRMARMFERHGQVRRAARHYLRALELDPQSGEAREALERIAPGSRSQWDKGRGAP